MSTQRVYHICLSSTKGVKQSVCYMRQRHVGVHEDNTALHLLRVLLHVVRLNVAQEANVFVAVETRQLLEAHSVRAL